MRTWEKQSKHLFLRAPLEEILIDCLYFRHQSEIEARLETGRPKKEINPSRNDRHGVERVRRILFELESRSERKSPLLGLHCYSATVNQDANIGRTTSFNHQEISKRISSTRIFPNSIMSNAINAIRQINFFFLFFNTQKKKIGHLIIILFQDLSLPQAIYQFFASCSRKL